MSRGRPEKSFSEEGYCYREKGHKARAAADARLREAQKVIRWELSERERKIVDEMSRKGGEDEES